MKMLSKAGFKRAQAYIFEHGRPLDQALFDYQFSGGPPEAVLEALGRFQNPDGGFGNALEPDLRTPVSSAVATSQGLTLLREVHTPSSHPIVSRAVDYLLNTFERASGVWEIIPPAADESPRAWWWEYANSATVFGGFLINPRAAILGHLHHYRELVPADFLKKLTAAVLTHLNTLSGPLSIDDMACYLGLIEADHLPESARSQVLDHLQTSLPESLELDPEKWGGYCLKPLDVSPSPGAPLATLIPQAHINAHLNHVIGRQLPDGSWPLTWSWAERDPEAWSQAEREWKGHLAVHTLRTLQAWDRIEGGA